VSSDAMEMFGVLDLEAGFEGCRFAIGIRNANNKRFRLSCTVGLLHFRAGQNFGDAQDQMSSVFEFPTRQDTFRIASIMAHSPTQGPLPMLLRC